MSWHFTEEKIGRILRDVQAAVIWDTSPMEEIRYQIADLPRETASGRDFDDSAWNVLPASRSWGSEQEITAWLRTTFVVPSDWRNGRIMAHIRNVDCETIAYVDGKPISSLDGHHFDVIVAAEARPGAKHVLALEAYSGLSQRTHPNAYVGSEGSFDHRLAEAEFRLIDQAIYEYAFDLQYAYDATRTIDRNNREYGIALQAVDEAINLLDFRQGVKTKAFLQSVLASQEYLRSELYDKYGAGDLSPTLWATGHSHIDTAWLWRLAHTRKKCQRTFTTQLDLMERYPDYVFSCSQPQHYDYVKEDNPELYQRIKEMVKRGSWVPLGGMWIEPDCNVVSGESFVRQFLYGIRFTEKELGFRTRVMWLPDVFGYSASLPQIMRKAGIDYFMTIKIFWNQVNRPPYQTFSWEGIDGTSVLAHLSPYGDYNADLQAENIRNGWDKYDQKHLTQSDLYIYGHGDGGGGVTSDQLEIAKRAKDFIGMPKLKLASPEAFFKDLETQVKGKRGLPVWRGELYFELHRGTYTSEGATKRANRMSEFLLQTTEQIASLAHFVAGGAYPSAPIYETWKLVMLNQFHDILPGSSINEVYRDSDSDYAKVKTLATEALDEAMASITSQIDAPTGSVVAYNPLSWSREDIAEAPASLGFKGQSATTMEGEPVTLVDLRGKLPPLGYAILDGNQTLTGESGLKVSLDRLENRFFTIALDNNGEITSIFDKRAGREVVDSTSYCKANALQTFEDKPMLYEAWDIDIYYNDKMYPIQDLNQVRVVEQGPIRAAIEIERTVGEGRGSTIHQRIIIYRDLPRIDFATVIDWKERQTLLKVAFPVTVNALQATYDIQFGNLERPTHWNTSWDWARFEVCGHKWADLSEGDYGVSLLSDSKYGWDIHDNVMRLTLIKSAIHPNPESDLGIHRFTYSLYPHAGGWREAQTVRRAYELNVPVKFASVSQGTGSLPSALSLVTVDRPNIIVETVKKAEDDEALIVRAHDQYNQRGSAILTFPRPIQSAQAVNLLENEPDGDDPLIDGSTLTFAYKPFEIRTFKVKLA